VTCRVRQSDRDLRQYLVTDVVPIHIIYLFEVVEVDEHKADQ
jgi:hypothetical protein